MIRRITSCIFAHCLSCGAITGVLLTEGAHRVDVEHNEGCAFQRAAEAGRGQLWVKQHGLPVTLLQAEGEPS